MSVKQRNSATSPGRRVRRAPSSDAARTLAYLAGRDFMTAAEVRGEAAYLVLQILVRRLPRPLCLGVMAHAYADADTLGIPEVTAEVNALFSAIEFNQS